MRIDFPKKTSSQRFTVSLVGPMCFVLLILFYFSVFISCNKILIVSYWELMSVGISLNNSLWGFMSFVRKGFHPFYLHLDCLVPSCYPVVFTCFECLDLILRLTSRDLFKSKPCFQRSVFYCMFHRTSWFWYWSQVLDLVLLSFSIVLNSPSLFLQWQINK